MTNAAKKSGSVLIAEDDELVLEILTRICQEVFAELVIKSDGTAALMVLGTQSFDLVISDLRMPGASGLVLLTAASKLLPACPLLLVSGYADDEAAARARHLGAHVLHKPFGAKSLRQTICKLCPQLTFD